MRKQIILPKVNYKVRWFCSNCQKTVEKDETVKVSAGHDTCPVCGRRIRKIPKAKKYREILRNWEKECDILEVSG